MWDSARKPIKVRSVLQSNGMRRFIVNEEEDEAYSTSIVLSQQKRKNSNKPPQSISVNDKNTYLDLQQKLSLNSINDETLKKAGRSPSFSNSIPLTRSNSHSLGEHDDRIFSSLPDNCENFFGVAGNKICNSKKHKGHHHNRYFNQFPQYVKEASLIQLKDNSVMNKCPHLKSEMLDLIPVKSPVIKKLINGRTTTSSISNDLFRNPKPESSHQNAPVVPPSSTTLCSRIMTWIDLEVKRNAVKGRSSSGSLSFSSADLSIIEDLNGFQSQALSSSPSSSSVNSGSTSPSGEDICATSSNSSCSTDSSALVSLPKLVPCWRKDSKGLMATPETGNKAKKSVRIADDLPRWGKMKRKLRKQDRSVSLNELYNDDELSISAFMSSNGQTEFRKSTNHNRTTTKANCLKQYSSVINLSDDRQAQEKVQSLWNNADIDEERKERDSFVVCKENMQMNGGRVQVHIFLPQTDNSAVSGKKGVGGGGGTCDNESNLSGRSEDSTV